MSFSLNPQLLKKTHCIHSDLPNDWTSLWVKNNWSPVSIHELPTKKHTRFTATSKKQWFLLDDDKVFSKTKMVVELPRDLTTTFMEFNVCVYSASLKLASYMFCTFSKPWIFTKSFRHLKSHVQLFWRWVFPYISHIHTAYFWWGLLH